MSERLYTEFIPRWTKNGITPEISTTSEVPHTGIPPADSERHPMSEPTLTPEVLSELRRLREKATAGPLRVDIHDRIKSPAGSTVADVRYKNGANDAALFVAAVNALPALLDAAERERTLRAERDYLDAKIRETLTYAMSGGEYDGTARQFADALLSHYQGADERAEAFAAERDALRAENERLYDAWRRYGQHARNCNIYYEERMMPCSCGLREALEGKTDGR